MGLIDTARLGRFLEHVKELINNHTHSQYALVDHTHSGYAYVGHTHSNYALTDHIHTDYASTDHTHSDYLPKTGGTISGDVNVNGILRIQGNQAFYYDTSESSQTIGTNNATGGTTICCGSSATAAINGALLKTPTVLPRSTGAFSLGNTNFRWNGIYSTTAVNVSSDARNKRDIQSIDEESLIRFVRNLNVVSYNYKDDPEDSKSRIGLIAQEVQWADPELAKFFVDEDEEGMLSLKPADLVFPLIVAVQNLSQKVEELSNK